MEQERVEGEITEQGSSEAGSTEAGSTEAGSAEQGSALELDMSIIHEPAGGIMSLSDFFGIPVFREDSTIAIQQYERRIEEQLDSIREQVFLQTGDREQAKLEYIQSQVFLDWPVIPQGSRPEEEITAGLGNTIFVTQLVGIAFILLMMVYIRKRKKEREKKIHDIHHFGS